MEYKVDLHLLEIISLMLSIHVQSTKIEAHLLIQNGAKNQRKNRDQN